MEDGRIVEQGPVFDVFADPQHPATRRFVSDPRRDGPAGEHARARLRERHEGRFVTLVVPRRRRRARATCSRSSSSDDVRVRARSTAASRTCTGATFGHLTLALDGDDEARSTTRSMRGRRPGRDHGGRLMERLSELEDAVLAGHRRDALHRRGGAGRSAGCAAWCWARSSTAPGPAASSRTVPCTSVLNVLVNFFRPIPFIIFIAAAQPLARSSSARASATQPIIFVMSLAATFGIARIVEQNLADRRPGCPRGGPRDGCEPGPDRAGRCCCPRPSVR